MGAADERRHVMLAMGIEFYVAQHHDVVIAFEVGEGARQRLIGILVVALEIFAIRLDHAAGGFMQALAGGIIAGPCNQRADGFFGLFLRGTGNGLAAVFLVAGIHVLSSYRAIENCGADPVRAGY